MPTLSVVIVTHDSREAIARDAARARRAASRRRRADRRRQRLRPTARAAAVRELAPAATVIETGRQPRLRRRLQPRRRGGAPASCSACSTPTRCRSPGWRDAIERPLADGRGWAAWQALVTADGGRDDQHPRRRPSLHRDRLGRRRGRAGDRRAAGRASAGDRARLRLRRLPGDRAASCYARARRRCPSEFFLYHEDVDLSLRVRLAGGALGVEPAARVDHDYEFDKGAGEVALPRAQPLGDADPHLSRRAARAAGAGAAGDRAGAARRVAAAGGWLPQKLRAWGETLRLAAAAAAASGARIQAARTIGAGEFAAGLTADARLALPRRAPGARALLAARPRRATGASCCGSSAPRAAERRWRSAARRGPRAAPARGGRSPGRGSSSPRRAARWRPRSSAGAGRRSPKARMKIAFAGSCDPHQRRRSRRGRRSRSRAPAARSAADHPEQRVALDQPPAADELEDQQEDREGGDQGDDLRLGLDLRALVVRAVWTRRARP